MRRCWSKARMRRQTRYVGRTTRRLRLTRATIAQSGMLATTSRKARRVIRAGLARFDYRAVVSWERGRPRGHSVPGALNSFPALLRLRRIVFALPSSAFARFARMQKDERRA